MSNKKNIYYAIIAFIIVAALLLFFGNSNKNDDTIKTETLPIAEHFKGNENSQVVLMEFSDFQCPACAAYYSVLKDVLDEFGDDIKIVYKHFPLSIHRNAKLAAQAAEAAGAQGRFWEMHDKIFEGQKEWAEVFNPKQVFIKYAEELSLDVELFKKDMVGAIAKNKVEKDLQEGKILGVSYTPYFILNGEQIENPKTLEEFKELIEKALSTEAEKGEN